MCRADTPPGTLHALLAAQPPDAPCIREAGFAPATYGALLAFISDGGGGDLRRLGVQPGDVVAYAAPGGSAVAAVAFLTIASQAVAAPLDAALSKADAENALVQLRPRHLLVFAGEAADGLRAAAARAFFDDGEALLIHEACLLYTSPSPRDLSTSRMPSSA